MHRFAMTFTADAQHIDVLGHVNNAVWVQWLQDLALGHWEAAARPADRAASYWVIVRHEIDYRGNIAVGDTAHAVTWIEGPTRGATSLRRAEFRDDDGRLLISAASTWAMIDRANGRLCRVRPEVLAPFADPSGG